MVDRSVFKEALNGLSSPERTAILYLEKLILETKIKSTPLQPKQIDLKPIEQKIRDLQKQYNLMIKDQKKPYREAMDDLNREIIKFNHTKSVNYEAMQDLASQFKIIEDSLYSEYNKALKQLTQLTGAEFVALEELPRATRRDPKLMDKVQDIINKKL